jgi:hypothetical protein
MKKLSYSIVYIDYVLTMTEINNIYGTKYDIGEPKDLNIYLRCVYNVLKFYTHVLPIFSKSTTLENMDIVNIFQFYFIVTFLQLNE